MLRDLLTVYPLTVETHETGQGLAKLVDWRALDLPWLQARLENDRSVKPRIEFSAHITKMNNPSIRWTSLRGRRVVNLCHGVQMTHCIPGQPGLSPTRAVVKRHNFCLSRQPRRDRRSQRHIALSVLEGIKRRFNEGAPVQPRRIADHHGRWAIMPY